MKQHVRTQGPATSHEGAREAEERGFWPLRRRTGPGSSPAWRGSDDAAYRAALSIATATLAAHDGGTAAHSDDVITLSAAIGAELGVDGRQRRNLLAAAELHDIGKVGVPSGILDKEGPLDQAEWRTMRQHTVTGERILASVSELVEVAHLVRHCHERWDGGGYPDGLAGEQIPLAARIVFCADAFHAIRSDRPYRRGRSAEAALAEVEVHAGTQFDPRVVEALVRVRRRMDERKRLGTIGGGVRSQRLAALLLAMTISGTALAAIGVWPADRGEATTRTSPDPPRSQPAPEPLSFDRPGGRDARRGREAADAERRRGAAADGRRVRSAKPGRGDRSPAGSPRSLTGSPGAPERSSAAPGATTPVADAPATTPTPVDSDPPTERGAEAPEAPEAEAPEAPEASPEGDALPDLQGGSEGPATEMAEPLEKE